MPREMSDQLREAINQSSFGTDDVKQARQSVTAEETATLQRKIAQKRGTPVTDLTTTHLKFLLEQATPGPWEYDPGEQEDERCIIDAETWNMCIDPTPNGEGSSCSDYDLELAAHAPELAQEVIRLREHFEGLITTMENKAGVSNGRDTLQELIVAENLMSAANQIRQILLGDHDE